MKILLWELRNEKGLSGRKLAEMSGIGKSTINNIENGKTSPKMRQMEALAKALDVGIMDLFESEYKFKNLSKKPNNLSEAGAERKFDGNTSGEKATRDVKNQKEEIMHMVQAICDEQEEHFLRQILLMMQRHFNRD